MAWLWCPTCGEKFVSRARNDEVLYVQNQEWSQFTRGRLKEGASCDSCNQAIEPGNSAFFCTTHRASVSTSHRASDHMIAEDRELFTVGHPIPPKLGAGKGTSHTGDV